MTLRFRRNDQRVELDEPFQVARPGAEHACAGDIVLGSAQK